MKTHTRALVSGILLCCGIGGVACSGFPVRHVAQPSPTMVLEKVDVALLKNLLRVEIETGGALSYSTSTSVEPPSVTIDLPGVS